MKKAFISGTLGILLGTAGTLHAEDISLQQVVLRGLDKVTGRLSTMTVNVGEKTMFGALDVYARVCYTHPPEETPENAAYLDIVENKQEGQLKLFSGWMFSSSPALSAMDHAVYDVWVLKCQGAPVSPPVPEKLVLEHPLEQVPVQPKLKIMLKETKNIIPEVPAEEKEDAPEDDMSDGNVVLKPESEAVQTEETETKPEEKAASIEPIQEKNDENDIQIFEEAIEAVPE
ncbi:MAG: DUF2155 domain-containing protein [Alphaproteobacteria bacterium]|nr:DUF2155 domain-containing protein [Alphaproteobacteria bacterium]